MLPLSLPLSPGVDLMRSPFQVGRGLVDSNLIRHRNGLIQKLGGCSRLTNLLFPGICRCLFGYRDLLGNSYLAVGTNAVIQLFSAGNLVNISPIAHTSNLTTPLATVLGSTTVTVTDAGYSPAIGSWLNVVNMTYFDGVTLQGLYQVIGVIGSTYTIAAVTQAAATASGGGAVLHFTTQNTQNIVTVTLAGYTFYNGQNITVGVSTAVGGLTLLGNYTVTVTGGVATISANANATSGASAFENSTTTRIIYNVALPTEGGASGAFGVGPFGAGAFGVGTTGGNYSFLQGSQPNALFLTEWSMDKWGQNLVFCWITSTVYQWVPPIAAGNVATAVSGAPSAVSGLFVAAPQQQAIAWGIYSATLGEQDPMLIGFCDVANLNSWTATAINQAGSFRLSSGNLIISGTWFGATGLFWTDIDIWAMTYIGFPLVYGFNKIAPNCGLIARRAWGIWTSLAAWMSQNDFFVYAGGMVQPIVCSVRDFVFNTLDTAYLENIHCDVNTYGAEMTWWFPQIGSGGRCTGAVQWHPPGGEWSIVRSGLSLSAWTDQSVFGPPIGAFYGGLLEQFDAGAIDFDGQILDSYITSGFFQIAEGQEVLFVERAYPDFNLNQGGVLNWTFSFADSAEDVLAASQNPGLAPQLIRTYGPFQVTSSTPYVVVRGRGRVMQHRIDANVAFNTFWRYGEPMITASIDGRRGSNS